MSWDRAAYDHEAYEHRHPIQPGERDIHAMAALGLVHTEGDEL
jgi:hypothetical protein